MQYRTDSRSGNKLSALGFGCMRFPRKGAGIDVAATEKLILRALELGVNYFDTAYAYGGSEEVLGEIMERNGLRSRMLIATKLPHGHVRKAEDIDRLFATSLTRLKTDYIDYYLIHNLTTFDQWKRLVDFGVVEWIADKRESGAISEIGFSFHGSISEFEKIMDDYDWDFTQIQYNYMNEHYQAGRTGLEMAARRGMPVIIMEPLLGGKLATGLPKDARAAFELIDPDRHPADWALRWLWNQPEVSVVLSGMNAPEQLEANCATAAEMTPGSLSIDELAAIEVVRQELGKSYKVPCTGCNYCMPCPQGISIPACFSAYNESYSLGWYTGVFHYLTSVGAGRANPRLASDCIKCGACVKKCPQHIDIPAQLEAATKRIQPLCMGQIVKLIGRHARVM